VSRCVPHPHALARALAAAVAVSSLAACSLERLKMRSASARNSQSAACVVWRDSIPTGGAIVYVDGEVDRAVALHRQAAPEKTPRVDGQVVVRFVVVPDGRVDWDTYTVLRSTDPALSAYVEELLTRSLFEPAMLDGEPVRQCIVLPYEFSADG
jgi:hypothetical protein